MARPFTPKVLTANRLIEGDVVYYTADSTWTTNITAALFIVDETVAHTLLLATNKQQNIIAGAYLANARLKNGKPAPIHFREKFRATGPSNYHHGKQAEKE